MKKEEIEQLLPWNEPHTIPIREFDETVRYVRRSSIPDQNFWDVWKEHKEELKSAGLYLMKKPGRGWRVFWDVLVE